MAQKKDQVEVPSYLKISKVVVWFLYFFILLGIISLIFRVFLLLFSADRSAGFSQFVGNVSNDYLQPFRGIFPPKTIGETGYLDVAALFAILVYLFLLWGVHSLIEYVQGKIDIEKAEQQKQLAAAQRRTTTSTVKRQSTR